MTCPTCHGVPGGCATCEGSGIVADYTVTFYEACQIVDREKLTGSIHFLHGKPKIVQTKHLRVRISA